jgi:hypothetical protein
MFATDPKVFLMAPGIRAPLFTYLGDNPQYAIDFVRGFLQLTTFGKCRTAEAPHGDKGEGHIVHHFTDMVFDGRNENLQSAAVQYGLVGIGEEPSSDSIRFTNVSMHREIPDSYMLCLTEADTSRMRGEFGPVCVRIDNPRDLFRAITYTLVTAGFAVSSAMFSPVKYVGRRFQDRDVAPRVPFEFLKPSGGGYSWQKELRMVWKVDNQLGPLDRIIIPVPETRQICSVA